MKKDNPWELGQEHITPDGTKLIVCQPERDGSGCMVCDGCWYLNNKKQLPCPSCRGPFVWVDASWGVIFRTPEQVKKDSIDTLESEKPSGPIIEEPIDGVLYAAACGIKNATGKSETPINQEELEEEIHKYNKERFDEYFPEQDGDFISEVDFMTCLGRVARHFAEWGAEWQAKQDQETIELAEDHAYLAGAVNEREQMMKGAVDFTLEFTHQITLPRHGPGFGNIGDKIRVIVLPKEDGE